ncbi:hypothetical protein BU26DRAFT_424880 [Trematosphaeria pertusa]|uniref:Serine hydrolase domain-containing protein n=1 Tax=Trematosphaeria pertusa TaxID=390896 RepID=A0A6A6IIJ2_9PLEO|nr:uncharacterized protein BU26DRAFT_424880 [Trematosphaeria pertusa]KAF2249712.1 hypothetical protein BU26DRAFT_424880 [Trematosphaeria pertusa]
MHSLRSCLVDAYASACLGPSSDIEFLYPNTPIRLDPSDFPGINAEPLEDCKASARWLDFDGGHAKLKIPLAALSSVVQSSGPVDAIVGFSQGAALEAVFAALGESNAHPERRKAHQEQERPIPWEAAQGPLEFAVCFSGFLVARNLYGGFYEPRIKTPIWNA